MSRLRTSFILVFLAVLGCLTAPVAAHGQNLCAQAFDRAERYLDLAPLKDDFVGEDRGKTMELNFMDFVQRVRFETRYLNSDESDKHRIFIDNGKVVYADGSIVDTSKANNIDGTDDQAIYVMKSNGDILISLYQKRGDFHHSSLVAGGPVAAAGEIRIFNGTIYVITARSGHYLPTRQNQVQLEEELSRRGYSLDKIRIVGGKD